MVNDELVRAIVQGILSSASEGDGDGIPVEVSARHVHLSREHLDRIFGKGYELTPKRSLSQPTQFLCEERVRVIGPGGVIDNVAIVGPVRGDTQVELSAADARALGIAPPVRLSGDLSGAVDVVISKEGAFVAAAGSAIIARNHIHMTPGDARKYRVRDGDLVGVRVTGKRKIVFENVPVRVSEDFALAMHIDFDEANACLFDKGTFGTIVRGDLAGTASSHREAEGRPAVAAPSGPVCSGKTGGMSPPKERSRNDGKRRMVVTAEMAKELAAEGEVVCLPRRSILTPLARDVFIAAKVKVEMTDDGEKERACLSVR